MSHSRRITDTRSTGLGHILSVTLTAATIAAALALPAQCNAQATVPQRADVPPPPLFKGAGDDSLEPVVTIRKEGDREVEEYRLRGQLFAMRVKVKGAPAYWLVDPDGSGRMVPGQGIGPTISVPKWVLKEF